VADVARNKALTILVERANVVDTAGKKIDLAELAGTKKADAVADADADADASVKAEKKPAKKAKKSD
jgi:trigger factor